MVERIPTPDFPAGPLEFDAAWDGQRRQWLTDELTQAPGRVRRLVSDLTPDQLDTRYRNWSVRQIVHHLADSHAHVYIRFKWTLTEDEPRIKAYDEGAWSALSDAVSGDIEPSLLMLEGIHGRWSQLLRTMSEDDFSRRFQHPEFDEHVTLWDCLNYYPWHVRHHTGQIEWLAANVW